MGTRDHQVSIRISRETNRWLEQRAGGPRAKAGFVRELIERERACEREESLLRMFDEAARDLSTEDRDERDLLLGAFAADREAGQ